MMLDLFLINKIKELKLIWFRCMDSTPTNNLLDNAQSTRLIRGKTNECTALGRFYSMYEGSITYIYIYISSRIFENLPEKCTRIFAQKAGHSQLSGHCAEKIHRGLAVLLGLIVKFSP